MNTRQAEIRLKELGKRAPRVVMRSLNRAGASARTAMSRVISKDMGVKVGAVRDRINLRETTTSADSWFSGSRLRLSVTLFASAKRLPLILFKASGPRPSFGKGRGVSANMGGRKRYPHAFIATMASGHEGVFQRKGPGRLPIAELRGPSIAHVFKKYEQVGIDRAQEQLAKTLGHELAFEMSQTA
ncbi:MAG TPA: phage tail protein [Vicinamibacterales bacterium]|nr:phage tail protein [Vicinamibacterales bacterium]